MPQSRVFSKNFMRRLPNGTTQVRKVERNLCIQKHHLKNEYFSCFFFKRFRPLPVIKLAQSAIELIALAHHQQRHSPRFHALA
jgi:hypothetical protein